MIDFSFLYQVTLFGNYEDITPVPDTIKYFMDEFAYLDMVPTTIQEMEIPSTAITNRLALTSTDNIWSINFQRNRIEISKKNNNLDKSEMGELDDFISNTLKIIKIIEVRFPKKYTRIALLVSHIFNELSDVEKRSMLNNVCNTVPYYNDATNLDWINRIIGRVSFNDDLINIISDFANVLLINKLVGEINRIMLQFEFSTDATNTIYQYDYENIKILLEEFIKIESIIKSQYLELISSK